MIQYYAPKGASEVLSGARIAQQTNGTHDSQVRQEEREVSQKGY
jgi:hypothetical protein